jgi:hypothetical protein
MVYLYNSTKHRSIKTTPFEASNPENESQVYQNLYDDVIHDTSQWPKPKFSVVRIEKKHTVARNHIYLYGLKNYLGLQKYSILIRLHIS